MREVIVYGDKVSSSKMNTEAYLSAKRAYNALQKQERHRP